MGITYQPTTPLVVEGGFGDFITGARCPDFQLTRTSDGKVLIEILNFFNFNFNFLYIRKFDFIKQFNMEVS
jgi:hypothetical protein